LRGKFSLESNKLFFKKSEYPKTVNILVKDSKKCNLSSAIILDKPIVLRLYNHPKIKAMVSFTKAEGFGRPLLEFSTTGKPIIAPHYSGQADFLKEEFICKLPGQLTPIHPSAQNEFLIGDAKWFTPDYRYASNMFEEVHKNYKKWIEPAKRQRYFANSTFTKTAVAKIYTDVLSVVDHAISSIPKSVELKLPELKKIQLPRLETVGK
jgi:hypothetical protein